MQNLCQSDHEKGLQIFVLRKMLVFQHQYFQHRKKDGGLFGDDQHLDENGK